MLDADDDLESMWDPEEDEDDMQDNKFSSHSNEGDGDDEADVVVADVMVADSDGERHCEDKEDSSDDFFDSGEGAVIGVTAARALSPKLHISYLDLCCLDTRTLPLSSLGITLCI